MAKRIINKGKEMLANYRLSKNFMLAELIKTSQPYANIPNDQEKANLQLLVDKVLQPIRDLIGEMRMTSAFRSEQVNNAVGGVPNSQHRLGFAGDFQPVKMTLEEAFKKIKCSNIPYDQLILETGKRGERWIHVSYSKSPRFVAYYANWNHSTNKMDYQKA